MMKAMRAFWLVLAMSVRVGRWQLLASLGEQLSLVVRLLQPLYLTWLVTGVLSRDLTRVTLGAGAFVASISVCSALGMIGVDARTRLQERVGAAFDAEIARITGRIPTLDHLESARYLDELQALRDQQGALGQALNELLNAGGSLIFVGGTIALAVSADPRLLLAAAASVPGVLATRWLVSWRAQSEQRAAEPGRLARHFMEVCTTPANGAEVRVFQLEHAMRTRLKDATRAWRTPLVQFARRQAGLDAAMATVFYAVAIVVLLWLLHDTIAGQVQLHQMVLALLLVGRLQATSQTIQDSIDEVSQTMRTASRYVWLLDYERQTTHPGTTKPPATLADGIRLDHISFTYPGTDRPVLHDITLDLPAGSVVALVGDNGAGKSTLVKLLTGMYRPTSGQITVDGTDLVELDIAEWRARSTGAFQDHARFELSARQAVGVGDLAHLGDDERIRNALREGTAEDVVAGLPRGVETQLGSHWPDGVDLSGGQWQRLSVARGMMRATPLLLVLDEPTAALDPATEHELFTRYAGRAARTRGHGGVTLLVTHRFSMVAAAATVVVLDSGRVTEHGTHAELIARGGQYAQLYDLQARGYR